MFKKIIIAPNKYYDNMKSTPRFLTFCWIVFPGLIGIKALNWPYNVIALGYLLMLLFYRLIYPSSATKRLKGGKKWTKY